MITAALQWATSQGPKENSSSRAKFANATGSNFYKVKSTTERDYVDTTAGIDSILGPDTLILPQYLDNLQRKIHIEPERRLIVAILEDAIQCFQANIVAQNGRPKKLLGDAEKWLLNDGTDWIFSFRNICHLLELDPEYLRAGLMRLKQRRLSSAIISRLGSDKHLKTRRRVRNQWQ